MNISLLMRKVSLPRIVAILFSLAALGGSAAYADEIFKVAGNGTGGFSGDGGQSVDAQVSNPRGVAVDSLGNIYIADSANHRVRRIAPNGTISTFAGTGVAGFTDDSDGMSLAANAQLNEPTGVAVDSANNVYIADKENSRIRRIDVATGIITTIAGDGGVLFNPADDGQPAVNAALRNPYSVHVAASGNIYIVDQGSPASNGGPRVRMVDAAGTISTVAGNGSIGDNSGNGLQATATTLDAPYGIYVDANENLYIADSGNHNVRRVDNATGVITSFAGTGFAGNDGDGGLATVAHVRVPRGVTGDAAGNIYIADYNNSTIRRVDVNGIIETTGGTGFGGYNGDGGDPLTRHLDHPIDVFADGTGQLFIADFASDRVRVIGPDSLNNPVTDVTLDSNTVDDDEGVNAIVGVLDATDADVENHDFALVAGVGDTDNALFNISGVRLRANDSTAMAPGDYSVRIDADDEEDSNLQEPFTITVVSKNAVAPVVTLTGDNPQIITIGDAYVELGATAMDDIDGDISANIVIDATAVNTAVIGMYNVTYTVSDSAVPTNVTVANRAVNVVALDSMPPVITLLGANPHTLTTGSTFTDFGATAMDDVDGDISASIVVDFSAVNIAVAGSYVVTYNVMDAAGNAATEVSRTVTVQDPIVVPPPPTGGGGGSFGVLGLLFLIGTAVRRRIFAAS